jgi:hypothetical protein
MGNLALIAQCMRSAIGTKRTLPLRPTISESWTGLRNGVEFSMPSLVWKVDANQVKHPRQLYLQAVRRQHFSRRLCAISRRWRWSKRRRQTSRCSTTGRARRPIPEQVRYCPSVIRRRRQCVGQRTGLPRRGANRSELSDRARGLGLRGQLRHLHPKQIAASGRIDW